MPASPPAQGGARRSPAETRGIGRITFGYALPMMRLGMRRPLTEEDVPPIRRRDCAGVVVDRITEAWEAEHARNPKGASLLWVIARVYRAKLLVSGVWCLLESAIRIVQPLLLKRFMAALRAGELVELYSYAGALVAASLLQAVIHHQLFFETMTLGWNLRIGVTGALHWKLLRLRPHVIQTGCPDCYNLVSNDSSRFDMALPFLHFGWAAVMDIVAVAVLLILEVGWLAALSGVSIVLVVCAVMMQFGKRFAQRRKITAAITDERMKLTSEVIGAMASVKVYCWEDAFIQRIGDIRRREHQSIFKRQTMVSTTGSMYFSLSPLACLALFLVYIGQGERLSLPTVYAALGLIMVLRLSVGKGLNMHITMVPELFTAIRRFTYFLALPEVQPLPVALPRPPGADSAPALEVRGASFAWPSGTPALSNLSFQLRRGELLVVSGPVGCGKSALLQALLGDLDMTAGSYQFHGSIGYAPQTPWISATTLRSNVLLGEKLSDQAWYDEVIAACCLEEDLLQLGELGDETQIGERGVNLSGGQRARVGLARVVHAKPDVALLDDPLAAVDPAVVAHLVRRCLCGEAMSVSAVVLCTHQEGVFALADKLLLLGDDGNVRGYGPPKEVMAACGHALPKPIPLEAGHSAVAGAGGAQRQELVSSPVSSPRAGGGKAPRNSPSSLVKPEDTRQGSVSWRTYVQFARLASFELTGLVLTLFLSSQVAMLVSSYWIGVWAEADDQDNPMYLWVFVAVSVATVVFACLRSILFYHSAMRASSSLHARALRGVFSTHLGFFTANPQGRILNRFSGDLGNTDDLLSQALHEVMDLGFLSVGTVLVICTTVPPLIPGFVLMFVYMFRLRQFVVKSMTELKRMDSVSRSPILDRFNASLKGLTPIRAFGRQHTCQGQVVGLLQRNAENWFWWLITNRFIGFRLDMLSAVVMGFATFGGAVLRDFASPELVGLAIINAISLSGVFQYMVRQSAAVESFMTSFERLLAYARLPGEPDAGTLEPGPGFPAAGAVAVSGLRMRYREDLPEVLKGVDFAIHGGLKVGICGRTGSGKSSIFMALARLADNTAGSIAIDGVDTARLPLLALRRCIAWVPQEPSFFSGTVRLNLDPLGAFSDETIAAALRSVQMADAVGAKGLDAPIEEGGSNFSIGERQLLSLARALLQRRKVLCMDEAFANVDFATDGKVQAAIQAVAEDTKATVIVVAHRVQTLADSEHLVVMDDGMVAEHGAPADLLRGGGAYAAMVSHVGHSGGKPASRSSPSLRLADISVAVGCFECRGIGSIFPSAAGWLA